MFLVGGGHGGAIGNDIGCVVDEVGPCEPGEHDHKRNNTQLVGAFNCVENRSCKFVSTKGTTNGRITSEAKVFKHKSPKEGPEDVAGSPIKNQTKFQKMGFTLSSLWYLEHGIQRKYFQRSVGNAKHFPELQ